MTQQFQGPETKRVHQALATAVSCLLIWGATATTTLAKRMQAPGSRISVDLPDNQFKASPLFAGFMDILSSAALILLELPAQDYDRVTASFTPEALAKKDLTNIKLGKLDRSDQYMFLTGQQKHPRDTYEKFILVIKDAKNTAVLTFNVPQRSFNEGLIKRELVLKALASAKLEAKAAPSRDLFKLTYRGPFKLAGSPTGTSRIFVEQGASGPKDTRNLVVVAPSLNRLPVKNVREFSKYAIQSLSQSKDLTVTNANDVQIDNMDGHLLTATAKRGKSDTEMVIRQLFLLPAQGGYFRLLAINRKTDDARLAPEIKKIFDGFRATTLQPIE